MIASLYLKLEIAFIFEGFWICSFIYNFTNIFFYILENVFSQACDAWQKEAQEAKERADVAAADKQLALQKKEEVENKLKKLKVQLAACLSTTLPYIKNSGDIEKIPLPMLRSLQSQLHLDLGTVDEVSSLHLCNYICLTETDSSVTLNEMHMPGFISESITGLSVKSSFSGLHNG